MAKKKYTVSDPATGDVSFTFDYEADVPASINEQIAGTKQEPERFMLDVLEAQDLYNGTTRAINRRTGREMILPTEVYNALTWCDEFRTLEEHTAYLAEGNPGAEGQEHQIAELIRSAHEGGLTLSAKELAGTLSPVPPAAGSEPVKAVVTITTWERPDALKRLLESMLSNVDAANIHHCYVVDDSRSKEKISENRQIVATLNERPECTVRVIYFGAEQMSGLMQELIARLPEHETAIRFLIDRQKWSERWTNGLVRNYCQLLSVGSDDHDG
jgi:hypothetical protein